MSRNKIKNQNGFGYTFYPKDWRTDPRVITMKPDVRDMYRFLIDECYIRGEYKLELSYSYVASMLRLRADSVATKIELCCNYGVAYWEDDLLVIPSVIEYLDNVTAKDLIDRRIG